MCASTGVGTTAGRDRSEIATPYERAPIAVGSCSRAARTTARAPFTSEARSPMTMLPAEDDAGDERLPGLDAKPSASRDAIATLDTEPSASRNATATVPDAGA